MISSGKRLWLVGSLTSSITIASARGDIIPRATGTFGAENQPSAMAAAK